MATLHFSFKFPSVEQSISILSSPNDILKTTKLEMNLSTTMLY